MIETLRQWIAEPAVRRIIAALVAIAVVYMIVRLAQRRLAPRIEDTDTRYRFRKFTGFIGYVAYALILAAIFSNRLGTFGVTLGVVGAGVAFALQEVVVSVAGWVSIMFGGTYRVGDRILLGGTMGDVIDVSVLRTTLMECGGWVAGDLYNGRIVKVSNSYVFKEPVTNYTSDFPFLWDEIVVPITHGSDVSLARSILDDAAAELVGDYAKQAEKGWERIVTRYRIENAQVHPMVSLNANENWMAFTLRYVVDYRQRRATKDKLWERILDDIGQTQGKVEIAFSTLHVTTAPIHVVSGDQEAS